MRNTEMQLELLLRRLPGETSGAPGASSADDDVSTELRELHDLALRLRAARQHLPVSMSLRLVRAVVSAATRHSGDGDVGYSGDGSVAYSGDGGVAYSGDGGVARVRSNSHRWQPGWAAIAAAVLLGAFGLGVGATSAGASPSSPWYGARLAIENAQVALTPSARARAELLVKNAQARLGEIQAMAATGDTDGLRRAADALDADAGWLHAVLKILPAQERRQLIRGLGKV
ncbi:MAG TPA: DUF5667 domain-containing protein [bacterium]|nr:DUF5667 domain-containing protein [bacterium]